MCDAASDGPIQCTLRDGTRVLVRPVEPDDKDKFVEGFARLSSRSRYLRFHSGIEQLSAGQLRYLTEVDQRHHVAWVAIDRDDPDLPGIGVARFVRLGDAPEVAEAAITVLDEYQGRGLGTLLLGVLAQSAVARGVEVFRSYVLGENRAMLELFDRLGATRTEQEPGVWQVDLALPGDTGDVPSSAATDVFRAVTGKQLPPMRTTAPPVWLARDRETGREQPSLRNWLDRMLGDGTRHRR